MANLTSTQDIINDALIRSNEPTTSDGDYYDQALVYLNRAYRSLYMGGTEFLPEANETWWWMKAQGSLILNPSIKAGTVTVTKNSTSVTFSSTPSTSVADYFFKVDGHSDVFRISSYTASDGAVLDTVYTGDTSTGANYRCMDLEYSLATDIIKMISPMRGYGSSNNRIEMMSESEMQSQWPLETTQSGVPDAFAMVTETTVRFNRFGSDTGDLRRVDYDYIARPADLTNSATEVIALPLQYRHILSDMVAMFILTDKDDEKAVPIAAMAKAGIKAMELENKNRWAKAGKPGRILPRQSEAPHNRRFLRTNSGVYIS